MLKKIFLLQLLIFLFIFSVAEAQIRLPQSYEDAKAIVEARKLKITGGFQFDQIVYGMSGIEARREPYTYFATGNINFSIFQLNLPLSFTFTNQELTFDKQVPVFDVNQISLKPQYKWVQLYIGHSNMSFSPYTLNGHQFVGGGVELTPPGHINISAMYGRLQEAVKPEEAEAQGVSVAYERWGYGFKIGYQLETRLSQRKKIQIESVYDKDGELKPTEKPSQVSTEQEAAATQDLIEFSLFTAQDKIESLTNLPDSLAIFPEDNVAMSLHLNKTFFQRWVADVELGSTALTRSQFEQETDERNNVFVITDPIFQRKVNTSYYTAVKARLDYQADWFTLGGSYERIDPEYRTLGAYYFNNDFENIALNGTTNLFENKINLAASVGSQRNNLNDAKLSTQSRLSTTFNVNYIPIQSLNFSVSYSNLQSFTRIRPQLAQATQITAQDNLTDSLNYTQVVQNVNVNTNIQLTNSQEKRQFLNINLSWQEAADEQGNQNSSSSFYNANLAYNYALPVLDLSIVTAFNYNENLAPGLRSQLLGPTLTVKKSFFEKQVQSTLTASYNQAYTNGTRNSTISNIKLNSAYVYKEKHQLNLNLVMLVQRTLGENAQAFTEFTGTLSYAFSF